MSAKTLSSDELGRVISYVHQGDPDTALRNTAVIILSFKAGLRVGEIAGLRWADVTDAFGQVRQDAFVIPNNIAKKGSGRTVPMHPALYATLLAWKAMRGKVKGKDHLITSVHGGKPTSGNTLQRYISRLYTQLGLEGCSSHSGRRSFITQAARRANEFGCSLRDVQRLAGHRDIETTEVYIEASAGVANLVRAM